MKLTKTSEIEAFRAAIAACEGEVWLESPKGDRFNLNSIFSQYVALGAMLSENGDELELFCSLPEDEVHFYKFFHEHPEVI